MDLVEFEKRTIRGAKGQSTRCVVTVTPTSEDRFTLMLEIKGAEGHFVTPSGTSNKSVRTFKSNGFMEPRRCEMDLVMDSTANGDYTTTMEAYTANSDKPKVKLILTDANESDDTVAVRSGTLEINPESDDVVVVVADEVNINIHNGEEE